MKASIKNIIRFDYFTKFLAIIAFVAILLLIGIVTIGGFVGIEIILPIVVVVVGLIAYRAMGIKKVLDTINNNRVVGKVTGTQRNNGNFYISFSYEFNGESFKKRVGLLIGPLLKLKLAKMETINLVVDKDNPKKVYIADLFYK